VKPSGSGRLGEHWPLIMVAGAAFLAPVIGGQVPIDPQPLEPGLAPLLDSLLQGPQAALLAHALIALFAVIPLAYAATRRQVLQLPPPIVGGACVAFLIALLFSMLFSQHRALTLTIFFEWALYVTGMFAVVAVAGRTRGPVAIVAALFGGCVLVALLGVREYFFQPDPTWRIFSTWFHPNVLAGMLGIGLFLGLGLTLLTSGSHRLLAAVGTIATGYALLLTQSKGGLLAILVGLVIFIVGLLLWVRPLGAAFRAAGIVGLCLVATAAVSFALPDAGRRDQPQQQSGWMTRFGETGATQEQSAGFRILLWRSTGKLMQMEPAGVGLGTYRFHSSRPGIITPTQYAHNSYLQLGAEASAFAPILFLAALGACLLYGIRGSRNMPLEKNLLRIGVLAAVATTLAHNVVDSDFYHFGIGFSLFVLLGVLLQISADGSAPEFAPRWLRGGLLVVPLASLIGLFYLAHVDIRLARLQYGLGVRDLELVKSEVSALQTAAGYDYRTWFGRWFASGFLQLRPEERIAALEASVAAGPTTRALRNLAREYADAGRDEDARSAFRRVLRWDPNNLLALIQWMRFEEEREPETARWLAQQLIEVEPRPYFQIRAIPELVPTETYEARMLLASYETDAHARAELLRPAVDGYLRYRQITVPRVMQYFEASETFAGETPSAALLRLNRGAEAARELADVYRSLADNEGALWAEEAERLFRGTAAEVESELSKAR
jgi:O-antigen ligase